MALASANSVPTSAKNSAPFASFCVSMRRNRNRQRTLYPSGFQSDSHPIGKAGRLGIEPRLRASKTPVLPLHHRPKSLLPRTRKCGAGETTNPRALRNAKSQRCTRLFPVISAGCGWPRSASRVGATSARMPLPTFAFSPQPRRKGSARGSWYGRYSASHRDSASAHNCRDRR